MAETLAPAIELFAPAAVPKGGAAVAAPAEIAREAAARLAQRAETTIRRPPTARRNLALLGAALGGAACCLVAIRLSDGGRSSAAASCPRKSPAASEWMERHALPVAMACVACHPAGSGQLTPSSARSAGPLGRSL
jgi:surfactin synthase thioesterase subunit